MPYFGPGVLAPITCMAHQVSAPIPPPPLDIADVTALSPRLGASLCTLSLPPCVLPRKGSDPQKQADMLWLTTTCMVWGDGMTSRETQVFFCNRTPSWNPTTPLASRPGQASENPLWQEVPEPGEQATQEQRGRAEWWSPKRSTPTPRTCVCHPTWHTRFCSCD